MLRSVNLVLNVYMTWQSKLKPIYHFWGQEAWKMQSDGVQSNLANYPLISTSPLPISTLPCRSLACPLLSPPPT